MNNFKKIENGDAATLIDLLYERKNKISELVVFYNFKNDSGFVDHKKACVGAALNANSTLLDDGYIQITNTIAKKI